jgi:hypothetical protein
MTGNQPVFTKAESELVDQVAHRLSPKELGLLTKRLVSAKNPNEAARIRESIYWGFYGSH